MAQDDNFQFYDKDGELITLKALFEYGTHILHVISTDAPHQHIHEGIAFIAGHNAAHGSELANDASQDILVQVGASDMHLIRDVGFGGSCEVFVLEGVTFTGAGTALTVFNKDRGSSVTSLATVTHTPAGVSGGTALPTKLLPGGHGW